MIMMKSIEECYCMCHRNKGCVHAVPCCTGFSRKLILNDDLVIESFSKELLELAEQILENDKNDGTGLSPDIAKIKTIYNVLKKSNKELKLAVASGLTPENIVDYKDYITCAIVATGIFKNFYEFDEDKFLSFMENSQ